MCRLAQVIRKRVSRQESRLGRKAGRKNGSNAMIPQEGFKDFMQTYEICQCEVCATNRLDWQTLSNTEKMVKAVLLKAQFAAELNRFFD